MRQRRLLTTILAVTALGISALAGAAPALADEPAGAPYVAIGDSVASGNGLTPYYDTACLRSKKAYPTLLAGMLGGSVVSAACSGSPTTAVAAQAAALAQNGDLGPATQLVTITAGVNNLPWIAVLGACSDQGTPAACDLAMYYAQQAIAGVPIGIAQTIGAVRLAAPGAMIVVTGYPYVFGAFSGMCSVGAAGPGTPVKFSAANALAVNGGVLGLNNAVQVGIAAYQAQFAMQFGSPDPGVQYVDVTAAFAGHGLCDSGDRFISGLVPGQPVTDRGFHPNVAGQQAYAATIAAALAH